MADILASFDLRKLLKAPRALLVGHVDLGELRRSLDISQSELCRRYGFALPSVRNWEQRLSRPDAAARAYLAVIARDPERVAQLYAAAAAAALAGRVPRQLDARSLSGK